jgi:nitrite reductase/ring-hydroxylating ferredoxin subunit/uncharacterized membrane protein
MRSRAHFRSHPLHPILIAFPVAFTVGALAFDLAGHLGEWPTVWSAGAYLSVAAVVSGVVAGVPGLIDYFGVVPPNSSAKTRATYHMVVNLTALALFALGWVFRDRESLRPGLGTLLLEAAGVGLIGVGGWMGGTLVYRNQIGVDHRYAHAGKWTEFDAEGRPGEAVAVADAGELKPGQMKLVHANGRRVVLARTEDGHAACADRCTHKGGPLSDGVLACGVVTCPWHGSQFDVRTGAVRAGPAEQPIETHRVEEAGGQVRLTLPPE